MRRIHPMPEATFTSERRLLLGVLLAFLGVAVFAAIERVRHRCLREGAERQACARWLTAAGTPSSWPTPSGSIGMARRLVPNATTGAAPCRTRIAGRVWRSSRRRRASRGESRWSARSRTAPLKWASEENRLLDEAVCVKPRADGTPRRKGGRASLLSQSCLSRHWSKPQDRCVSARSPKPRQRHAGSGRLLRRRHHRFGPLLLVGRSAVWVWGAFATVKIAARWSPRGRIRLTLCGRPSSR